MANGGVMLRPITWPLLPVPDVNGQIDFPSLDDSVRQLIKVILLTRPGEQLMRPEFGAGLSNFLQRPNTLETRREIRDLIAESLESWEPRIVLDRVEVWELPGRPTHIRVELAYRLRRTGSQRQLALVMELES